MLMIGKEQPQTVRARRQVRHGEGLALVEVLVLVVERELLGQTDWQRRVDQDVVVAGAGQLLARRHHTHAAHCKLDLKR